MSWIVPDTKSIWAPERWGFKKMIKPLTGSGRPEGAAETGRRVRRCRKCDGPKPEVSFFIRKSPQVEWLINIIYTSREHTTARYVKGVF